MRRAGYPDHVIDGTPIVTMSPQEASALLSAPAPEEEEADDAAAAVAVEDVVQASMEVVEELMVVDVEVETA
eukprot:11886-Eustigmatos_ZCMA.PRE.1